MTFDHEEWNLKMAAMRKHMRHIAKVMEDALKPLHDLAPSSSD